MSKSVIFHRILHVCDFRLKKKNVLSRTQTATDNLITQAPSMLSSSCIPKCLSVEIISCPLMVFNAEKKEKLCFSPNRVKCKYLKPFSILDNGNMTPEGMIATDFQNGQESDT